MQEAYNNDVRIDQVTERHNVEAVILSFVAVYTYVYILHYSFVFANRIILIIITVITHKGSREK